MSNYCGFRSLNFEAAFVALSDRILLERIAGV